MFVPPPQNSPALRALRSLYIHVYTRKSSTVAEFTISHLPRPLAASHLPLEPCQHPSMFDLALRLMPHEAAPLQAPLRETVPSSCSFLVSCVSTAWVYSCCMDFPATPTCREKDSLARGHLSGTSSSLWSLLYSDPMRSSWS